ncbi:aldose 1-epimerase [Thiospirochaeta perfilievii]|uniref:Aldose 1-epimerase n=1 Tax=Thiospirochaeta perfilievii TaxID=252967 RepID=A0A5C1QDU7_9SPIO|nr:aldose 1-epimerase [Thiospirochaeta perfilievii]QEN05557.1 aldose 1-epimerase [Thiospirochaeta perfilievii]
MIKRNIIDGQEVITLSAGKNSVSVVKSLGGMIYELELDGKDVLFSDRHSELTKNDLFRGRLLFPFNDRIPKGEYCFDGKTHAFPLNCDGKDSIHGLIYNRTMDEINTKEDENTTTLTLETVIDNSEFKGYPFKIGLNINYIISNNGFKMDFKIFNPGESQAPYAFGWHPYFTFGNVIDLATLQFDSNEYYDVDENLYYKGNHYSVKNTEYDFSSPRVIGDMELDIAISLKDRGEFVLSDCCKKIEVNFSKDLFPALQLFIPDDRLSIAVEPITGPSDSFNYPEAGLKLINPGEEHLGYVEVKLG